MATLDTPTPPTPSEVFRASPPTAYGFRLAGAVLERKAKVYRRAWILLISGFLEPVFYLFSLGVGLGTLVDGVTVGGQTVSYEAFVAPAMLVSSAMQGAIADSTFNVFFSFKYAKLYDAMLATPMSTLSITIGEVGWAVTRGSIYSAGFLGVMLGMGLVSSWWAVLVLPVAVLTGFAFAGAGIAATTFMRSWQDFSWINLAIWPLFLLSATFFPLETYPEAVQPLVRWSPLYPAVDLARSFTLGTVHPGLWVDALYLLVLGVAGTLIAIRRLGRLLLT